MITFSEFALAAPLLAAVAAEGYTTPTPIQSKAIPPVLAGRDVLGIAQTGTGKTAAFALPILQRFTQKPAARRPRSCRALILAPTRELASQIADSFRAYGRQLPLTVETVFGGVPLGRQERALASGVDILVATPGRLLDLIDRRALTIRDIDTLVLDEADQMLDLGFIHALRRIVTLVPKDRQSLFFSATMPKTIASLADSFLRDPVQVAVAPVATTVERVQQRVIFLPASQKQALLHLVLAEPSITRVLVFTRTKHGANRVVNHLLAARISAAAIHGNKSQPQREKALDAFRAGACRVLVATDIAARGIDVDGVSHVINFELPNVPEQYVHRIGRTARAGADGMAISFCDGEERAFLRDIERLTRQKVPVMSLPEGFDTKAAALPRLPDAPRPARSNAPRNNNGRPAQAEPARTGRRPPRRRTFKGSRPAASAGAP